MTQTTLSVTDRIAAFVEEQFLVTFGEDVTPDTNLFSAGVMDSFGYVQLVTFLQREFGLSLGDDEILNNVMVSLSSMAKTVNARLAEIG